MKNEPSMDQAFLERLTKIVKENLDNEQFGVRDLAREAGMSRSKIHRKLHKLTGQSTTRFIREIRLWHAMELLKKQVGTISEIAYRVGFGSPNYFSKCFHEYYGFPPGEAAQQAPDEAETEQKGHKTIRPKRPRHRIVSTVTIITLLFVISGYYVYQQANNSEPIEKASIAVLPLHNLTGNEDQDFFVDGLHDALIGELGQLRELRVISRTSTLRYRNSEANIKQIAEQLGVDNIIEGSVYRAEDSVRIQLQLIDVDPEEEHIWAENYDRYTGNILSLLSDVTRDVANSVQITLSPEEDALLAERREVNPDAYKAYLRGIYHLDKFTPESYQKGISYLLEATRLDPADPLPWARLALGYNTAGHGIAPPPDAYELAEAAAERALKLDETLGEVQLARTIVDLYDEWDWEATRQGFERTIRYDPNIAETYAHYSWFIMLEGGNPEEILNTARRAMQLDPFTPLYPLYYGFQAFTLDRLDEAVESAQKSIELNPDYAYGYYVLGLALGARGDFNEALEAHKKAVALNPRWEFGLGHIYALNGDKENALAIAEKLSTDPQMIDHWGLAEIHAALGNKEEALNWLEASYESRFSWTPWIEWNPNYQSLVNEPRFGDLLERMDVKRRSAFTSNY